MSFINDITRYIDPDAELETDDQDFHSKIPELGSYVAVDLKAKSRLCQGSHAQLAFCE